MLPIMINRSALSFKNQTLNFLNAFFSCSLLSWSWISSRVFSDLCPVMVSMLLRKKSLEDSYSRSLFWQYFRA